MSDVSGTVPVPVLNRAQAVELLELAVAERGEDYIYGAGQGYAYLFGNGSGGCIVGTALSYLENDELNSILATHGSITINTLQAPVFGFSAALDLTQGALDVLSVAQTHQDCGHCWGEAVKLAKETGLDED